MGLKRAGERRMNSLSCSGNDVRELLMPKEVLTITLEAQRRADLDRLAAARGRDRDTLIEEAIADWLDLQAWQTSEIEAGLRDAESGNFATKKQIDAAYGRS